MKQVIRASASRGYWNRYDEARKVLSAAKNLYDTMEDTHEGFLENNDLMDLYDELGDCIRMLTMSIKDKTIEE